MKLSREFINFVVVGAFAALVNFVSRIFLNFILNYQISVILAYLCGFITAYIIFKRFVFKSDAHISSSLIKFALVNVLTIIQTYFVSVYLNIYLESIGVPYSKEIAHFIGISVPVISSYFGHKYFSFR